MTGAGTMNGICTSGCSGKEPELEYPVRFGKKSMKSYSGADSEVGSKTALNHREEGVKRQCEILLDTPSLKLFLRQSVTAG